MNKYTSTYSFPTESNPINDYDYKTYNFIYMLKAKNGDENVTLPSVQNEKKNPAFYYCP